MTRLRRSFAALCVCATCGIASQGRALPVPEAPTLPLTDASAPAPDVQKAPAETHTTAPAPTQGPRITLAPGTEVAQRSPLGTGSEPAANTTVLGGYGEAQLTSLGVGPNADFRTRANLRRLVLFVSHAFDETFRVYTELEWENAIACASCQGSVEIEQAFVDAHLVGNAIVARAGLVLVPLGVINRWHEPPVFHGVERPATDRLVIPTTWRELGVGFTGEPLEGARYELYLTTTLDPTALGADGLSGGRTLGSLAPAEAFAFTGRAEFEPVLGLVAGVGFFASDLGGNAEVFTASGRPTDLSLPLIGYAIDARWKRFGIEARGLWAQFFLPNSGDLISALREDGSPWFPNVDRTGPVATRIEGGYVELAYDVFWLLDTDHQLLPFARLETYDTQAAVPDGENANPELDVDELTVGLTYRPIPRLVVKTDVQRRDRRLGYDEVQFNFGLGFMF